MLCVIESKVVKATNFPAMATTGKWPMIVMIIIWRAASPPRRRERDDGGRFAGPSSADASA
jgi:hypothetical protein